MDLQVVQVDPKTGAVSFGLTSKTISGSALLNQIVVLSLLNTPGKDIFNPDQGGGILSLVASNFDPQNKTELAGDLTQRVKKVQAEIIRNQTGLAIPVEERLRNLQVMSIEQGASEDDVMMTIRVVNEAGRVTDLVM